MDVQEHDLPGIGKKFAVQTRHGDRMTVIIHNTGHREIYHFEPGGDYPKHAVRLEDAEAVLAAHVHPKSRTRRCDKGSTASALRVPTQLGTTSGCIFVSRPRGPPPMGAPRCRGRGLGGN